MDLATPAAERACRSSLRRFYLYKFLNNFQLWFPIWVLYLQRERGLSLAEVTALDAPFWLVMVLAEIPTGALADRWGRRPALVLGSVLLTVAIFLFGVSTTFPMLLVSYLIWGAAMTLGSGADTAFVYDTLAAAGRGDELVLTLGRARAFETVAALLGALAGAPLAAATSLSFPIVLSAGFNLLAAAVVLTLPEPNRARPHAHAPYGRIVRDALRYPLRRPRLRAMVGLYAVLTGAGMAGFIFVQPFLASYEVPVSAFGLLSVPTRVAAAAGSLIVWRLGAGLGERRVVAALAAGLAASFLVLGTIPSIGAYSAFVAVNFCNAAFIPLALGWINRHVPDDLRATLTSVAQMASSVVLFLYEPLLGLIADRASLEIAFLVQAIVVVLLGGMALAAWVRGRDGPHPPAPSPNSGRGGDARGPEQRGTLSNA